MTPGFKKKKRMILYLSSAFLLGLATGVVLVRYGFGLCYKSMRNAKEGLGLNEEEKRTILEEEF